MPVISVIVPVYQKEKFLPTCIESVLNQTISDLELILIDDESPDRCGEICDEFSAKDDRVIVIHQKNQGVSAARNAGLDIAAGEYLAFVDADDWILPDMYENMIKEARSSNAEIVACGIQIWSDDGKHLRNILLQQRSYDRGQMLEELFKMPDQLGGTCCNKIFRRRVVESIRFPLGINMCEDRIFLLHCYNKCNMCVKIATPYSQVTETANSATRTKSVYPIFSIISNSYKMIDMASKYSKNLAKKATHRYIDDSIRYMRQIKSIKKETRERCFIKTVGVYYNLSKTLLLCYLYKKLPKSVIHGYVFELLKL